MTLISVPAAEALLRDMVALRRRLATSALHESRQLQFIRVPSNVAQAIEHEAALLAEAAELLRRPPLEVRSRHCKAEREAATTLRTLDEALDLVK